MILLLLFIAIPLIEIALFIQIGSVMNLGWILLIVVLTAILGTWLVRKQGRGVLVQLQQTMQDLRDPTEPLAHGAMVLFSGALLLTPGFFTDTIGFLLLVPAIRQAAYVWLRSRVVVHHAGPQRRSPGQDRPAPDIIEGDYTEVEPERRSGSQGPSGWTRH